MLANVLDAALDVFVDELTQSLRTNMCRELRCSLCCKTRDKQVNLLAPHGSIQVLLNEPLTMAKSLAFFVKVETSSDYRKH